MENTSKRLRFQFNLQNLLLFVLLVAMALGWWRTYHRLAQSQAQLHAIRRSHELDAQGPTVSSVPIRRKPPVNRCQTPEEFITALREIEDWYEFADKTADPFAKTPMADDTIPLLLDLLDDSDAEIRTRALATLGKIQRHPDVVIPAVIPFLNDGHMNVRWHAAYALGNYGDEARVAIPALESQMNDDESAIATFSAMMLKQIDDTISTEARLIELLSNPIDQNRERAVGALASLGTPRALEVLLRRYRKETDPQLRDQLASRIARLDAKLNPSTAEQHIAPEPRIGRIED